MQIWQKTPKSIDRGWVFKIYLQHNSLKSIEYKAYIGVKLTQKHNSVEL